MSQQTQIITRQTAAALANQYQAAKEKIIKAYDLLQEAADIYKPSFDSRYDPLPRNAYSVDSAKDQVLKELSILSWRYIINLMHINKLSSSKRWKEIQKNLDDGALPELTEDEILRMYEAYNQNAQDIFREKVVEIYNYLRPGKSRSDKYKTNNPDEIGSKIILTYTLSHNWDGSLKVNYRSTTELNNLWHVFKILDGKTSEYLNDGWQSKLITDINENPINGENEYFKWKGYQNGNLHLTIKDRKFIDLISNMVREQTLKAGNN